MSIFTQLIGVQLSLSRLILVTDTKYGKIVYIILPLITSRERNIPSPWKKFSIFMTDISRMTFLSYENVSLLSTYFQASPFVFGERLIFLEKPIFTEDKKED